MSSRVAIVHSLLLGRDRERSFYRIPKIIDGQGLQTKELSVK